MGPRKRRARHANGRVVVRQIACVGAAAACVLGAAGCFGGDEPAPDQGQAVDDGLPAADLPRIVAVMPATDDEWLVAVKRNAEAAADRFDDIELALREAHGPAGQSELIEQAVAEEAAAIVVLPGDPHVVQAAARDAVRSGIPVVAVDQLFRDSGAANVSITGDNHEVGVLAAGFIADELNCKGEVVEIQGPDDTPVTKDRSAGFRDGLKDACPDGGVEIVASRPADFDPDKGQAVMEQILTANDDIDAVYAHDDDIAVGVVQAITDAGREDEIFVTGVGGSKSANEAIAAGSLFKATLAPDPKMAAGAVQVARLLVLGAEAAPSPRERRTVYVKPRLITAEDAESYPPWWWDPHLPEAESLNPE